MKHIIASVAVIISMSTAAFSASLSEEAAKLLPQQIKDSGVLRIGMPDQGQPFAFKVGSEVKGMDVGLAKELAEALGLKPEMTLLPFDSALTGLQADKFDLSFGEFYIRPERLKVADFVTSWMTYNSFTVLKESGLKPQKLDDMCGYRVASMAGSAQLAYIQKAETLCPAGKKMEVVAFPNTSGATLALKSKRVDAIFVDRGVAEAVAASDEGFLATGEFAPSVMAIAIQRSEKAKGLAEAVKVAMEHLEASGDYVKVLEEYNVDFGKLNAFDIYYEDTTPPNYE